MIGEMEWARIVALFRDRQFVVTNIRKMNQSAIAKRMLLVTGIAMLVGTPLIAAVEVGIKPGLWRIEKTNSLKSADGSTQTGAPFVSTICERSMEFSSPHEECRDVGTHIGKGRITTARLCTKPEATAVYRTDSTFTPTTLEGVESTTVTDRQGRFLRESVSRISARRIGECSPSQRR